MFGESGVNRFFIERAFAVLLFDDVFGRFTLSETGDVESPFGFIVRFLTSVFPFLLVKSDFNADYAFFSGCNFIVHKYSPIYTFIFVNRLIYLSSYTCLF